MSGPADLTPKLIHRLTHRLATLGEREIPSHELGEWVMDELRELDPVAYVRFASVYRTAGNR